MKAPSSVSSAIKSNLERKITSDMKSTNDVKAVSTPGKTIGNARKSVMMPVGPKSADADELDEIYKKEDPIESSLSIRKKSGALASVVPDKNAKSGKFFFTLRMKGTIPEFSEK